MVEEAFSAALFFASLGISLTAGIAGNLFVSSFFRIIDNVDSIRKFSTKEKLIFNIVFFVLSIVISLILWHNFYSNFELAISQMNN